MKLSEFPTSKLRLIAFSALFIFSAVLITRTQAQNTPRPAERRTVIINREPVRELLEDPYSNFSGMAIDPDKGELFLSNDNERKGQSIEAYHVEFPPERS